MKKSILLLAATLTLTLAACGSKTTSSASTGKTSSTSGKIVAVGSTAFQPLVEAAKQYQTDNPGVDITVQGGGSGAGLSQVAAGAVTIGNSDVFAQEKDGIDANKLVDHQVAVVGVAPVVHPGVGVTGTITNWKQVGGKDQSIVLINRAQGSGTRATFEQLALKTTKVKTAQEQDSSGTVAKMVASTPGAISYLAFSAITKDVQALAFNGVKPTAANVATNAWPVWAYEHMYTKGSPNAATAKFINYLQSKSVQGKLVTQMGYIPIVDMQVARTHDGKIEDK